MTGKKAGNVLSSAELTVREDLGEGQLCIFDPIQEVAFLAWTFILAHSEKLML